MLAAPTSNRACGYRARSTRGAPSCRRTSDLDEVDDEVREDGEVAVEVGGLCRLVAVGQEVSLDLRFEGLLGVDALGHQAASSALMSS